MPSMTAYRTTITILPLKAENLQSWIDANVETRGGEEVPRLSRFWDDMQYGRRVIFAAWHGDDFLGHVTVQDQSEYQFFRRNRIPEIVDLWVQPVHRRRGIARALLLEAEKYARDKKFTAIGLGVGVTQDYGPAHRLYASFDFKPDGTGLWSAGRNLRKGDEVVMSDDMILMWVKEL